MFIVTPSMHKSIKVRQQHNLRNWKITDKEPHIDPNGYFAIWRHVPLHKAYQKYFNEAVKLYNASQKRKDRRIENYYSKVKKSKIPPVYEIVVYAAATPNWQPGEAFAMPEEEQRKMLREYFDGWEMRNPNFKVIGAYYHADEPNGQPHLHIDYIPIGHYERGLSVRCSQNRALEEMGFKMITKEQDRQQKEAAREEAKKQSGEQAEGQTEEEIEGQWQYAIEQWQAREVELLDEMCRARGYEVVHPIKDGTRGKSEAGRSKEKYIHDQKIKAAERIAQQVTAKAMETNELLCNTNEQLAAANEQLASVNEKIAAANEIGKIAEEKKEAAMNIYRNLEWKENYFRRKEAEGWEYPEERKEAIENINFSRKDFRKLLNTAPAIAAELESDAWHER